MRAPDIAGIALTCAIAFWAPSLASGREANPDPQAVVARVIERTKRDIDEARRKLIARRKEITDKRVTLARRVAGLESTGREKRVAARALLASRDERDTALARLRDRVESLEERTRLARSVLVEFRRSAEARLGIVGASEMAGGFAEVDRLLATAEKDTRRLPEVASRLLGLIAGHVERGTRIRRHPGRAVGPGGREREGVFVRIGCVQAFFAGEGEDAPDEDTPAGIVCVKHGSSRPHFHPLVGSARAGVRRLARGEDAVVPVDLTSGAALRASEAERSFVESIKAGGVVMIPIILIGVVCAAFGLWKLAQLVRVSTDFDVPFARLVELVRAGDVEKAQSLAQSSSQPLRRLMSEGVDHHQVSRESLEEIMHEAIMAEVPRLEHHLSLLAVGAAVSPLLGLLGTVTGMIHTFSLISLFGTGDPRLLSGGISEALITTQAGLVVAIPLLLMHAFLRRRVNAIADGLEKGATGFINALKLKNGADSSPAPPVSDQESER